MVFWVTTPYRLVGDCQREEGHAIAVFRVQTLREENLKHVNFEIEGVKGELLTKVFPFSFVHVYRFLFVSFFFLFILLYFLRF